VGRDVNALVAIDMHAVLIIQTISQHIFLV
jgi:hypothetical protein